MADKITSISENHRNALAISLRLTEKRLRTMERDLEHGAKEKEGAILYRTINDIGDSAKRRMLSLISAMLVEIRQMKEDFGLKTDVESTRSNFSASLGEIWVTLEELKPTKLEDYGHMSGREKALIEPRVLRLLELRNELQGALHPPRVDARSANSWG